VSNALGKHIQQYFCSFSASNRERQVFKGVSSKGLFKSVQFLSKEPNTRRKSHSPGQPALRIKPQDC